MRNQGSTLAAYGLAILLLVPAVLLLAGKEIDWSHAKRWVDGGSCLAFSLVLFAWASSKSLMNTTTHHHPASKMKIGFETITMLVAVVAATVAVLTLTDAASRPKIPEVKCSCVTK